MTIDLLSPFWSSLIVGIILMIILGTYHYAKTLVTLNYTNEKFGNILSELDSLQKNQKEKITKINERNKDEMKKVLDIVLDIYAKKIDMILKHNQPPQHAITLAQALMKRIQTKKC